MNTHLKGLSFLVSGLVFSVIGLEMIRTGVGTSHVWFYFGFSMFGAITLLGTVLTIAAACFVGFALYAYERIVLYRLRSLRRIRRK